MRAGRLSGSQVHQDQAPLRRIQRFDVCLVIREDAVSV